MADACGGDRFIGFVNMVLLSVEEDGGRYALAVGQSGEKTRFSLCSDMNTCEKRDAETFSFA